MEPWFRPLVWLDYRLAVLFAVLIPIALSIWAFVRKVDAMQRLFIIYWRVSSLLVITLYMTIASIPIGFVCGIVARILIPISLWFWVDLNEEIDDLSSSTLKWAMTSWRWAMTVYSVLGLCFAFPSLRCGFIGLEGILETPACRVWLEVPWKYKEYFHANTNAGFLGFLGIAGLIFYVLFLTSFVFRLSKQGRSAMG
ncbi:MAG: DUF3177 family protein [Cyanobacteriota bacterium]|nr:DUF3177 family protein [Cyanobacteriota bacterium]